MEQQNLTYEELSPNIEALDTLAPYQQFEEEIDAKHFVEQTVSSADANALTMMLRQEARSRRNETLTVFGWSGIFIAAVMAATRLPEPLTSIRIAFFFIMAMGVGTCLQLYRRSSRRKRYLANTVTRVHNVEQVGALVQTLQVQNTPVRNLAKQTLIGLLPTLQATDVPLLGEHERKILLRQLAISPNDRGHRDLTELFSQVAYRREVDLQISILKALEQIGGAKELSTVERLARGMPTLQSTSRIPEEIREAAKECLPFLQSRVSEQRDSEQLLRPSSIQETSIDLLLRPATS